MYAFLENNLKREGTKTMGKEVRNKLEKLGTGRKYSTHLHYLSCRQFSSSVNMRTECVLARYCLINSPADLFLSKQKNKNRQFPEKKKKFLRFFSSGINESFRHGSNLLYVRSTVQTQQSNSHKRKQLTDWLTFYCCH